MIRLFILLLSISTTMVVQAQEKTPTNKHFWHSEKTSAAPEKIWQIWTDVPNWKDWDSGLKEAAIKGEFGLNAKGIIRSLEGRKSKFKIVEFVEGKSYTFKTNLPLGGLYVKRYLAVKNGQTYFTHEVWFKGITAGIFAKAFGKDFRKILPEVLTNIKTIAEASKN